MVLKRESVKARLRKLEEVLARLHEKEKVSLDEYKRNVDLQWFIERGLEVASSLILDIGNHILAGAFQISVDEYEQILSELHKQKVISGELYRELRGLGDFRNVLVHGYLDHDLVYAPYEKALQTFPGFIAEITSWLEGCREDENAREDATS
jgi:uncharacterized protein YutE (UPF0331/DUF86 family)